MKTVAINIPLTNGLLRYCQQFMRNSPECDTPPTLPRVNPSTSTALTTVDSMEERRYSSLPSLEEAVSVPMQHIHLSTAGLP